MTNLSFGLGSCRTSTLERKKYTDYAAKFVGYKVVKKI
jgi:hypothetical protein